MLELFKHLFGKQNEKNYKMYSNAHLYNLLGQDYDRIMEFGLGKNWIYESIKDLHLKLNQRLEVTDFKSEQSDDNKFLKLKDLYRKSLEKELVLEENLEENGTSGQV
jgi:hypothetical protein